MNLLEYPFDSALILKKKKALKKSLMSQNGLIDTKIAILSGSTIGDIKDVLELFLLSFGIMPTFYIGNFNRWYEDVMFNDKGLKSFEPNIIYIHTSQINLTDDEMMDKLHNVWEKIKSCYNCTIIQNNFDMPYYCYDDGMSRINKLNLDIYDYAQKNKGFYINDIQRLSASVGITNWFNPQEYYLYKYAQSVMSIPLVCHNTAKIIKSIYGKNQKCLVLDLDNTLWGGIIGEIGAGSIEVGMDTAIGETYLEFQKYVKCLYNKGVILAVCSKNDENTAKSAFGNSNMVLRLDDFAVFCANWNNKAENIINIAESLNILPESIVFVDDNKAERELVKCALPEVKVPDVSDVSDFIKCLEEAGYFYMVNVDEDDAKRNEYYKADAKRQIAKTAFSDYYGYLRSLQMSSAIQPFTHTHLERITRLINKTNQFNLTAKRYSLNDIKAVADDSGFVTLYATLDDKFGGNGVVSALIGEACGKELHIRLWVMSCRVFKRDLELAVFDRLIDICKNKGINAIIGYYYKTDKNTFVSDLYNDLGFMEISGEIWQFNVTDSYKRKNRYITVNEE